MSKSMMFRHAVQGASALEKFIEEKNHWRGLRGQSQIKVGNLLPEDIKYLKGCWECDASPENVAMDGEASASYVRSRTAFLKQVKAALEAAAKACPYK